MTESILDSIKKLLGLAKEYTAFDADVLMHINSVIMIIRQLGIGPEFAVEDDTTTWAEYLGDDATTTQYNAIKSYIYLKVRKLFDPPTNGTVMASLDKMIDEFEYRLYAEAHWPTTG